MPPSTYYFLTSIGTFKSMLSKYVTAVDQRGFRGTVSSEQEVGGHM